MKQRGFTLIEVMIVIAILAILISIVAGNLWKPDRSDIGASMRGYINQLYPKLTDVNIVVSNRDSDGNGYYSCTATGYEEGKGEKVIIMAECDGSGNCRPVTDR